MNARRRGMFKGGKMWRYSNEMYVRRDGSRGRFTEKLRVEG